MVFFQLMHPPQCLVRFGSHQAVQPGVPGKTVFKGDDISGASDQPAACRHIGDVGKLVFGNVQKPGELIAVGGGLVEQNQKFTVCQHKPCGIGTEQLFNVLGQTRHQSVILANPLPQFVEEIGAVLVPEQQVKLIAENPGGFAFLPVLNHSVENGIQCHQHPDRHQLFA